MYKTRVNSADEPVEIWHGLHQSDIDCRRVDETSAGVCSRKAGSILNISEKKRRI